MIINESILRVLRTNLGKRHYGDVIMGTMVSQITSLTIVYSTVYLGADQRKHQSPASLAFVWGSRRGPVNSPQKWPVTRKMFPFDDDIMEMCYDIWKLLLSQQPAAPVTNGIVPDKTAVLHCFLRCQSKTFVCWINVIWCGETKSLLHKLCIQSDSMALDC